MSMSSASQQTTVTHVMWALLNQLMVLTDSDLWLLTRQSAMHYGWWSSCLSQMYLYECIIRWPSSENRHLTCTCLTHSVFEGLRVSTCPVCDISKGVRIIGCHEPHEQLTECDLGLSSVQPSPDAHISLLLPPPGVFSTFPPVPCGRDMCLCITRWLCLCLLAIWVLC